MLRPVTARRLRAPLSGNAALVEVALARACAAPRRAASGTAPGDVLLHRSPIPTYYFQQSLPKLAIPTLDATCDK